MKMRALCSLVLCLISVSTSAGLGEQSGARPFDPSHPPGATPCDVGIPIKIELVPLNDPAVGGVASFDVQVDSQLDPDIVQDMRVHYIVPGRMRLLSSSPEVADLSRSGRSRLPMDLTVPDEARYEIRARLVVRLRNGRTIAQTAVQFVDLGDPDTPPGMIGRIVTPDGSGIRVYQGVTVRN
jgi:hypothetical protein